MGTNKYIALISNGEEHSASAIQSAVEIEAHDQIIMSKDCSCTNTEHMSDCEIVYADLEVEGKNKKLNRYIVEMAFCRECGAYYIPQKSFQYFGKIGRLIHDIKGGVVLYELITSGPEFREELNNLEIIKKVLEKQLGKISKTKSYKEMMDEADSSLYSFQTLKYENDEIIHKKKEIEYRLKSPYHGRIDIGDADNHTTYYIGGAADELIGDITVHSAWSEIGKLYNDTDNPKGDLYGKQCNVTLRRRIRILKSELQSIENTFSSNSLFAEKGIYDKFLIQVLMTRKKSHHLTDIIATIQKKQNEIIEKAYAANIIVQGCAGSGKTMVLLHRLSYWLYNNKSLKPDRIKIITPSENFNMHINDLHAQLKLDEIEVLSVSQYYCYLLNKYSKEIASVSEVSDEENVEERYVNYVYSKSFLKQFRNNYLEVIMEYTSSENIEFIIECAKKCEFDFDTDKYSSDGDMIVSISSLVHSMYKKNASVNSHNARIQKKLNENSEINKSISEEIQIILDKIHRYESNYKKDLSVLISKKQSELQGKIDEFNKKIIETRKSNKNDEDLRLLLERKSGYLRTQKKYERLVNDINDSESIDEFASFMNDNKIKSPIIEKYIDEYKKQKNKFYDRNALLKKNEKDNEKAQKKALEPYLSVEENEKLKEIKSKYPSDISIHIFNKVFDLTIEEKLKEFEIDKPKNIYRYELYARLIFSELFWDKNVGEDDIICIDEGQDVSYYEYELIYNQNKKNNAYYSIYGDLNQRIKLGRGLNTWEQIKTKLVATEYELNENYRNTNQVTQYCNNAFGFNMVLTGVDGDPVRHITFDEMLDELLINSKSDGVTVVLLPSSREISKQRITRSTRFKDIADISEILSTKYDTNKISIMYVDEIKGIEFNKVYVMEEGMEKNEKYIAYTRSLDKLIIVH